MSKHDGSCFRDKERVLVRLEPKWRNVSLLREQGYGTGIFTVETWVFRYSWRRSERDSKPITWADEMVKGAGYRVPWDQGVFPL